MKCIPAFRKVSFGCEERYCCLSSTCGISLYMWGTSKAPGQTQPLWKVWSLGLCMLPLRAASTSQLLSLATRAHKSIFKQMHRTKNPIPSWSQQDRQQAHQNHRRGHKVNHSGICCKAMYWYFLGVQHKDHMELMSSERAPTLTTYSSQGCFHKVKMDLLAFFHKICLNSQIIQINDFPSFILFTYMGCQNPSHLAKI